MAITNKSIVLQIDLDYTSKRFVDNYIDDSLPAEEQQQIKAVNYDDLSVEDKATWDAFVTMVESNRA